MRGSERPRVQRIARIPFAENQHLALACHDGQRGLATGGCNGFQRGSGIEFIADRPIAGDALLSGTHFLQNAVCDLSGGAHSFFGVKSLTPAQHEAAQGGLWVRLIVRRRRAHCAPALGSAVNAKRLSSFPSEESGAAEAVGLA